VKVFLVIRAYAKHRSAARPLLAADYMRPVNRPVIAAKITAPIANNTSTACIIVSGVFMGNMVFFLLDCERFATAAYPNLGHKNGRGPLSLQNGD
jgi:hypothetical protein